MILGADKKSIRIAAKIIKAGGLVAFPTETVYGLGANALNGRAVLKIFKAKGRPADNPLIVHVGGIEDLGKVAELEIAASEDLLAMTGVLIRKFWPGPLTLVLPKKKIIPKEVSAGLETVAVRMPDNKVALDLIREAGVPIAAPSANISGRPSAVTASQVEKDFGGKIDCILNGGRARVGLESTVVDVTVFPPVILRQGAVTLDDLRAVIPFAKHGGKADYKIAKSPGMKYRHYAPQAPLILARNVQKEINKYRSENIGILVSRENSDVYTGFKKRVILGLRTDSRECARNLFTALRKFDNLKVSIIISEIFPERGLGAAVMERLRKAARK